MKQGFKKFVPRIILSAYHWAWSFLSALFFAFPSRRIKVIGVTGTNGKTTTAEMITAILRKAGYKTALLSSLKIELGEETRMNKLRMTMPGRGFIQSFLKQAVKQKCVYAVMEVTSEGVLQHRHRFIDFEAAVWTNLSPEHIEAHGSFENYCQAKADFIKKAKTQILNKDDKNLPNFNKFKAEKKYYYSFKELETPQEIFPVKEIFSGEKGIGFKIKRTDFQLQLLGEFNVYNALAAVSLGLSQGVSLKLSSQALSRLKTIPGRMEMVIKNPFKVFVDYAFTPNALEKVYQEIRSNWKPKKMICVLGACGGGRDKWKRPVLGGLAGHYCQKIIVTNEDPYDENPMAIIGQVAKGAGPNALKVLERDRAIAMALSMACQGDAVVITGKGSEPSICLARGRKIPWDDRQAVQRAYNQLYR